MSAQTLRLALPLPEDPAGDPPMESMVAEMQDTADYMAAAAGLVAGSVFFLQTTAGLYDAAGHYIRDENGRALSPQIAFFACECSP